MELFDLTTHPVAAHQPEVLDSSVGAARAIAIDLPAGEQLGDHEVHERAYLVVISGEVELQAGDVSRTAGAGSLAVFAAQERHGVRAVADARLLLVLAPWPGAGHGGVRDDASAQQGTL